VLKLLEGDAIASWFGRPAREVPDVDVWRWFACWKAAKKLRYPEG